MGGAYARAGSLVGFFFTEEDVVDLASAKSSDAAFYAAFFHAMLDRGVYLAMIAHGEYAFGNAR